VEPPSKQQFDLITFPVNFIGSKKTKNKTKTFFRKPRNKKKRHHQDVANSAKKSSPTSGRSRQARRARRRPSPPSPLPLRRPPIVEPPEAAESNPGRHRPPVLADQLDGAQPPTPSPHRQRVGGGQPRPDDRHRQGAPPLRRVQPGRRLRRRQQRRRVFGVPRRGSSPARTQPRLLLLRRSESRTRRTRLRGVRPDHGRHQALLPDRTEGALQQGVLPHEGERELQEDELRRSGQAPHLTIFRRSLDASGHQLRTNFVFGRKSENVLSNRRRKSIGGQVPAVLRNHIIFTNWHFRFNDMCFVINIQAVNSIIFYVFLLLFYFTRHVNKNSKN